MGVEEMLEAVGVKGEDILVGGEEETLLGKGKLLSSSSSSSSSSGKKTGLVATLLTPNGAIEIS